MEKNDLVTVEQRLFAAEDNPHDLSPTDKLLIIRLLVQGADENELGIARATLARQLWCSENAVYNSLKRLKTLGWVESKSGKRKGCANRLSVVVDRLPLGELKRTIISDDARMLAASYIAALKALYPKRRFFRNTDSLFAYRLQVMLRKCSGDVSLLKCVLNFALYDSRWRVKTYRGPHELNHCWKSLRADYDATQIAATTPAHLDAELIEETA